MSYILIVGRMDKNRFAEKPEDREKLVYDGRWDALNELPIPSVEIAHQIAKLCNLTSYCITESGDTWGREPVFCTQDILDYDKRIEQERAEHNASQSALADHINSQPKEFIATQFDYATCRVVFIRSDAEYNPHRSGKVLWSLSAYVRPIDATSEIPRMGNNESGEGLYFDHYKSEGTHARLYRRFLHDWGWRFVAPDDTTVYRRDTEPSHPDFKKLWNDLPAIEKEYWNVYHQIQNMEVKSNG